MDKNDNLLKRKATDVEEDVNPTLLKKNFCLNSNVNCTPTSNTIIERSTGDNVNCIVEESVANPPVVAIPQNSPNVSTFTGDNISTAKSDEQNVISLSCSSTSNDHVMEKIKEKIKEDKGDTSNVQAEHNNDQVMQSSVTIAQHESNDASQRTVNDPRRDKCAYGSTCYRKSIEHRTRFSHPCDPDYNLPDDRLECRYGVKCYRKSVAHRSKYKHSRLRVTRTIERQQTPQYNTGDPSSEESVEESEYDPSSYTEDSSEDSDVGWDKAETD